ncbi:MAG: hypothetical protein PVF73_01930 [Bacteroidales bacterium]
MFRVPEELSFDGYASKTGSIRTQLNRSCIINRKGTILVQKMPGAGAGIPIHENRFECGSFR